MLSHSFKEIYIFSSIVDLSFNTQTKCRVELFTKKKKK